MENNRDVLSRISRIDRDGLHRNSFSISYWVLQDQDDSKTTFRLFRLIYVDQIIEILT